MAVKNGSVASGPIYRDSSGLNPPALDARDQWVLPFTNLFWIPDNPYEGYVVDTQPIDELQESVSGQVAESFYQDWYNRVHVVPGVINLGNVVSTQIREVEVWNAFFTDNTLSDISATGASGMTLTAPGGANPPYTFGPLNSKLYSLSVTNDGAPTVSASYVFTFSTQPANLAVPTMKVLGQRINTWSYRPDWSEDYLDDYEWKTDVLTAYNNSEQRIRLRGSPRRTIEYTAVAVEKLRQRLNMHLFGWQHRLWALPIWTDRRQLVIPANSGTQLLSLDTTETEFEVGELVILIDTTGLVVEAAEIASKSDTDLGLQLPLQYDWNETASVYPARVARLQAQQAYDQPIRQEARLLVRFRLEEPGSLWNASELGDTYRGYPVLVDLQHNWAERLSASVDHKITEYDFETSKSPSIEYEGDYPTVRFDISVPLSTRSAIDEFKNWLYARCGRLTGFWFTVPDASLTLNADIGAGSGTISIVHANYNLFGSQPGRRDIRIELFDGTAYYRRILTVNVADETTEFLGLDVSFPVAISISQVRRISFMQFSRLEADRVGLSYITPTVANCNFGIRGLVDDV